MAEDYKGFREFNDWVNTASIEDLKNVDILTDKIGHIGLFHDSRCSPHDRSKSIYGDDVKYILPFTQGGFPRGLWQTPKQLSQFLIFITDKNVETYLDIGTFSGWTITTVIIYMKRFGIKKVDTYDIYKGCADELLGLWKELDLPITYYLGDTSKILQNYDLIFIDGDHDTGVFTDFETYKSRGRFIVFHDINDAFCPRVRECWATIKKEFSNDGIFHEFTYHPNGFSLMGIGVVEWYQKI